MESVVLTEAVYYILLALYEPMHGYGIMQKTEALSCGRVRLAAGTLYGALSTLLEKGWIRAVDSETNSRKKAYQITDVGKSTVNSEMARLSELLENGRKIAG
jgi:DNA-binding PadR family transcriptional regulator